MIDIIVEFKESLKKKKITFSIIILVSQLNDHFKSCCIKMPLTNCFSLISLILMLKLRVEQTYDINFSALVKIKEREEFKMFRSLLQIDNIYNMELSSLSNPNQTSEQLDLLSVSEPLNSNSLNNEPMLSSGPFDNSYKIVKPGSDIAQQKTRANEVSNDKETDPSTKTNTIQFCSSCKELYKKAFQGYKDDTVELNINFKTLLVQYFRQLIYLKQLSAYQIQQVEQFAERVPSFTSLGMFYIDKPQNQKVRKLCLQFLESSDCIRRILSGRCRMRTKYMMIKFIEKMRANLFSKNPIKWKQRIWEKQKQHN